MVLFFGKNKLDVRLSEYLEKRKLLIGENAYDALADIFKNVVLPQGRLPDEKTAVRLIFEEVQKKVMQTEGNQLWKSLMKLDFYLFLYTGKRTEEELEKIKNETALILNCFV